MDDFRRLSRFLLKDGLLAEFQGSVYSHFWIKVGMDATFCVNILCTRNPFPFSGVVKKNSFGGRYKSIKISGFFRESKPQPHHQHNLGSLVTFLGLGWLARREIAGNLSTQLFQDCHCTCLRQAGMIWGYRWVVETQRGGVATVW